MESNVHVDSQAFMAAEGHSALDGSRAVFRMLTPGFHHPYTLPPAASIPKAPQGAQQKSTRNSDKENTNTARRVVPISAPVPVWCASLGKNALKSILAVDEEEGNTLDEETQTHTPSENMLPLVGRQVHESEVCRPVGTDAFFAGGLSEEDSIPAMIIRPITPSTLIALTEPCLLSWCCTSNEPCVHNPRIPDTVDTTTADPYYLTQERSYAYLQHSGASGIQVQNMWGY